LIPSSSPPLPPPPLDLELHTTTLDRSQFYAVQSIEMNTRPPLPRRRALFPFIFLTCIGFVSFFKGFFPVKPLLPGYTNTTNHSHDELYILTSREGLQDSNEKPFSRLVFMLVDALRRSVSDSLDSCFAVTYAHVPPLLSRPVISCSDPIQA